MQVAVQNTRADFNAYYERLLQMNFGGAYKFVCRTMPLVLTTLGCIWLAFLVFYWWILPSPVVGQGFFTAFLLIAQSQIWRFNFIVNFKTVQRKRNFGKPLTLNLTEEGVRAQQAGEDNFFPWAEFRDVHRKDDALVLIIKGFRGFLIPDRVFASTAEAQSFGHTARAWWYDAKGAVIPPIAAP